MAGCAHDWARLAPIARAYYAAGGPAQQLRAMARHVLTVGGYGPCLKVILTLHKDDLLGPLTEGKVSGPPGNAFELVYGDIALAVRKKLHDADPVLGEWIRLHLYGDVYSSPGIDLRMKQLALCGFLGEADMPDQLFGHALAAFRFGATREQVEEAVDLAYESMKSEAKTAAHKEAFKIIDMVR
ncbi:hypothetical protein H632_c710p1 [Helicosporidium sp. ATCC 50920]|nr:hypothetical protein H632_c710p1 [Helicosporidium sp. ATCC 50920]|eukprot:KDD75383.1 hypothetical protein H632_c710p1 [Helicosporidium sp. ATCC 50920]